MTRAKLLSLTLCLACAAVEPARATVVSYDFENAPIGAISVATFGTVLNALGVTESSVIGATGGVVGVTLNGLAAPPVGANTTINFGAKSFAPGNLGTWNLVFGPSAAGFGINRFDFAYNETESSGFDVAFYGLDGISVLDIILVRPAGNASTQCGLPSTCSLVAYTNLTGIGRVSITDLGNTAHPLGDNLHIDNITVDTRPAGEDLGELPEPGTWLMVGTGAAAALFGHRFAKKAAA